MTLKEMEVEQSIAYLSLEAKQNKLANHTCSNFNVPSGGGGG